MLNVILGAFHLVELAFIVFVVLMIDITESTFVYSLAMLATNELNMIFQLIAIYLLGSEKVSEPYNIILRLTNAKQILFIIILYGYRDSTLFYILIPIFLVDLPFVIIIIVFRVVRNMPDYSLINRQKSRCC